MALSSKQLACIEAMLAKPTATFVELAEIVGVNRNTIPAWKKNEEFKEEYQRRLKEIWKDSEAIAVNTMVNLASNGDFKASKYILDSLDYAPTQKIEADLDVKSQVVIIDDLNEIDKTE